MDSALVIHRLHFAFTVTYHYLFPQLTMGLAPLIVIFKSLALWKGGARYNKAARFWAKIFAINFLFGVTVLTPSDMNLRGRIMAATIAASGEARISESDLRHQQRFS